MSQIISYGLGGYVPSKPNNNLVEVIEIPDQPVVVDPVREAAMAKLSNLGLTDDEIRAVIGY
jgi:hypothetical protein